MTTILVPDLGGDITAVMVELEELLLTYAAWESAGEVDPGELPFPLRVGVALAALRRVWDAVSPHPGRARHRRRMDRSPAGPARPLRARAGAPRRGRDGRCGGAGRGGHRGFVHEFRHQMSLSFSTSGVSPISMFVSLGATPRWRRDTSVVGQRIVHAR
ncbi:hypothetical protein ACFFMN_28165 [Planobispora siamensis]|uniref:hypothetical protein n=1 Tax=Planobispora siamensis TaxID=936338 RepID=UPI0019506E3F|nr:hypothetical protein [Planobispora siamensis]